MIKPKYTETDLAEKVIAWLSDQHWDIYQEVEFSHTGGVADIVAVRHGVMWIIECKTSYSFTVLNQASRWPVHFRSVAVPVARDRDYRVARFYYNVGVLEVGHSVKEVMRPPLFRSKHKTVKRYLEQLTDLHKTFAKAGSPGGYLLTPYKQTMMEIRDVVKRNPGLTIKELHAIVGNMHYAGKESFRGNVMKALIDFESDWCKVDTDSKPHRLYIR